ncbi:hypothetical protein Taro_016779 [Colocasia esculenta]|uniref:Protein kinase domain-containing protein n=1 Tax=Colocasia esculenta TaxID=4460 RepID=A0A843UPP1_COLES|nr:hypothetical protein [Colocasia esculenta]
MSAPASPVAVFFLCFLCLLGSGPAALAQTPTPPPPTQQLASVVDLAGLYSLRASLGLRSRDWPRKTDPCTAWGGVSCRGGRVVAVELAGLRRTRVASRNPRFAVDGIRNLTRLSTFNASGFALPGSIPEWFGPGLRSSLTVLDLRRCSVSGAIPSSLGTAASLTELHLSENSLTGSIPATLGNLSNLAVLNLSGNSLSGSVPVSLGSLSNLTSLDLSSNSLTGSIFPELGVLSRLRTLRFSNNSLRGIVPPQLGDLSLLVTLDLSLNNLSGSIPEDLRNLQNLLELDVKNNFLSGPLPKDLFRGLRQLQLLILSHNAFTGTLPESLWALSGLRLVDVSNNNFTSRLPDALGNAITSSGVFYMSHNSYYGSVPVRLLQRFSSVDISANYFDGQPPAGPNTTFELNCFSNTSNQRSLQECSAFYAQRGLTYDAPAAATGNTTDPVGDSGGKRNWRLKYILAGALGGTGLAATLAVAIACCVMRRGAIVAGRREISGSAPTPAGGSSPVGISVKLSAVGDSFTYEQMLQATSQFSESNLIKHGHSGDLYLGTLERGAPVVVKRIDLQTVKKDSYLTELDFFAKASHTRLVPFLGHCLEKENEKLLIYKYMPNGDLFNSLHRKAVEKEESLQSLDWITRLKIAIGIAEALCYLHHECSPSFIHRTTEQSTSGFASASASCPYDVYCLGKVLLALVTGELRIIGSNDASTDEWLERTLPCITIYEKELVTKILDPSLVVDDDLLEEVWSMAIVAKSCLNPRPARRPLVRYILKALENPLKVVREENLNSARLRTTSSRGSWNAAFFGSWRQSSSDIASLPGPTREGSSFKHSATAGSQGSIGEQSFNHRRPCSEIFPEPSAIERDIE